MTVNRPVHTHTHTHKSGHLVMDSAEDEQLKSITSYHGLQINDTDKQTNEQGHDTIHYILPITPVSVS